MFFKDLEGLREQFWSNSTSYGAMLGHIDAILEQPDDKMKAKIAKMSQHDDQERQNLPT